MSTPVLSGPCPGQAPQELRGSFRVGEGESGGKGGIGIPPSPGRALAEEARGPAERAVLQTAELGSRRLHR